MGSLMPGWDTSPGVPQAMRDDFDKPQEEGYFARLRSQRASGGGGGPFEPAGTQSLSRSSAPLHDLGAGTGLPHASTLPRQIGAGGGGAAGGGRLGAASSLPKPGSLGSPAGAPHNPLAPHKYHFTDWTEELSSLRKPGAKPGSLGHAEPHHGSPGPHDKHSDAWWRALEVGHLNEQPDTAAEADRNAGSYVPQFKPSTKLDFGEAREEEAATAK